jgi:hypothetical protein
LTCPIGLGGKVVVFQEKKTCWYCFAKTPLAAIGDDGWGIFLIFLKQGVELKFKFENSIYLNFVQCRRQGGIAPLEGK